MTDNVAYADRGRLVEAWQEFLSRWPWDWFATLTFRGDAVHPEAAAKRFDVWIAKINRELFGCRWYKHQRGVRWVRALEFQRREVIHYHSLIAGAGLSELRRIRWMDSWNELAGFARIEPPYNTRAVQRYCAKYVSKGGEIDIGGPPGAFENPQHLGNPNFWDVRSGSDDS